MNKQLVRVQNGKMIAGVCNGIADYFNIDPTIIRLIWAICTVLGIGSGILIYLIATLIIPKDSQW